MAKKIKEKKEKREKKEKSSRLAKFGRRGEQRGKEQKPRPDKKALRAQKRDMKEQTNPGGGLLLGILVFLLIVVGVFDVCVLAYIVMTLLSSLPV